MTDDLLAAATRALREERVPDDVARFTRARVMASLHQRSRRRSTRAAFLLPIAAVLVGSTAFATSGGHLPDSWRSALGISPAADAPSLGRPAERGAAVARRAPHAIAALAAAEPSAASEPPSDEAPAEKASADPVAATQPAAPTAVVKVPAASAPAADPTLDLYRAAHRKHFSEGDAAGALVAWDAYLAAAPGGRFSTEARYNRALCLARLGRSADARAALTPFAEGRFGGYRQQEATALSQALGE